MKLSASILSSLAAIAGSTLIYPLSINPMAEKNCSDPSYHFVMSDAFGGTTKDTTNAKDSYCRVVAENARLWK